MKILHIFYRSLLVSSLLITAGVGRTDELRVAVASNFADTMRQLAGRFEQSSDHSVRLIIGATGKQYAQIKNGAPFDIFFAADKSRPERLEKEGVAIPDSRFTYAIGKLVLWSARPAVNGTFQEVLTEQQFAYLAIANPRLAPYGIAAMEVLEKLGLWSILSNKIVRGENIGQTFQFVRSGNARFGFIALSQIQKPGKQLEGAAYPIPESLYSPIEQQAVLLKDKPAVHEFVRFIKSEESVQIIRSYGYKVL